MHETKVYARVSQLHIYHMHAFCLLPRYASTGLSANASIISTAKVGSADMRSRTMPRPCKENFVFIPTYGNGSTFPQAQTSLCNLERGWVASSVTVPTNTHATAPPSQLGGWTCFARSHDTQAMHNRIHSHVHNLPMYPVLHPSRCLGLRL